METPQQFMGWAGPEVAEVAYSELCSEFVSFAIRGDKLEKPGTPIWEFVKRVNNGQHLPVLKQETGDCVGCGAAQAGEYLSAYEIAKLGQEEQFRRWFHAFIYAVSRVAPECGNGRLRGAGSTGAWAAVAMKKYGILFSDDEGVPNYSGRLADNWGSRGPDPKFYDLAKDNLLGTAAKLSTVDEIRDALINYKPVTIASNQGFSMSPVEYKGYHVFRPSGRWAHQMCVPPKSGVLVNNQYKNIEDIVVGDLVRTDDGNCNPVTETHERDFDGDLVTIKTCGTLPLRLTPGHPVLVIKRPQDTPQSQFYKPGIDYAVYSNGSLAYLGPKVADWLNNQPVWIPCEEVEKGDYLLMAKPVFSEQEQPEGIPCTKNMAWLFGLYAADGSAVKSHKIILTLHQNETDLADRAVEAFKELGLQASVLAVKDKKAIRVVAYSSRLANKFIDWFGKQQDKKLPDFLFDPCWDKESIVQGLFDGDGTVKKTTASNSANLFCSTSKYLIWQLRSLLLDLHKSPSVTQRVFKAAPENWSDIFVVSWYDCDAEKKRALMRHWDNYYCCPVREVQQEAYSGKVYNLEVDNRQNYAVHGLIVHNCLLSWMDDPFPAAYRLNSWGNAHGKPLNGEPPGGAWQHAADLEKELKRYQCELFALSMFDGFDGEANYNIL